MSRLIAWLFLIALPMTVSVYGAEGAEPSYTPLTVLAAPRIMACAEEYPGFAVERLVDDLEETEYASMGKGLDTFVDFDFGQPVAVRGFQHTDRRDVATVARAELVFSNDPDFGDVLARETIVHVNASGATTITTFAASHVARYVRWQATQLNAQGHQCLGGRDIRFFTEEPREATIERDRLEVRGMQAIERGPAGSLRPIVIRVTHVYVEPAEVSLRVGGLDPMPLTLEFGTREVTVRMPAVDLSEELVVALEQAGSTVLRQEADMPAVRPWELHFLAHSHVDIGYTHVQTEVEQNQWDHLRQAIEIARKTADYPPEARFKWNSEVLWAVDSYLRQADETDRQQLLQAVREGVVHLDGLYGNELTALCRPEELMRLTDCARRLSRQYGVTIDAAMISDVPGYTWGIVPALTRSGIKYLSIGPNHIHRIGGTLDEWGDRPFYWVSPSGEERLLCWMAGKAYSWFHGSRVGTLSRDSKPDPFFDYLDELLQGEYPYDLVQIRYSIGGDNGPPDQELSEFVRVWNEKYEWPRMVISTTSGLMRTFEQRYGSQIPEVRGDFTPYWEDGAASSARETAMARGAAERLVQAEALWALLQPRHYPADAFYAAWRDILLYNEHTWGAHCSINEPDSEFTLSQWRIKQRFALDAREQSRTLLADAWPAVAETAATVRAVDVWNTTSWTRTDLVRLRTERPLIGYVVKDLAGNTAPSTRTARDELAFLAQNVPPFAATRYLLEAGEPQATGNARAEGLTLSNGALSLKVDSDSGAISSLRWQGAPIDLVDPNAGEGLNDYRYVAGRVPDNPAAARLTRVEVLEAEGLAASLAIQCEAPGARRLTTILRLIDGIERVDIFNVIDKEAVLDKESVHLAFPFQVPGGVMRINTPWAVVVPQSDQLPGACKNYLTVGRWVDISNDQFGVTWATLDAPLMEVGGIHVDVPQPLSSDGWIDHLEPTQKFYSYLMNNYWETNYKASQEGVTVFRYSIWPHAKYDQAATARFAIERSQPLLAIPASPEAPVRDSPLQVAGEGVVVTSLKPSDDGTALMIRLFNAGDRATTAQLKWSDATPQQVTVSSPREEAGEPVAGPLSLPPLGIVTLRATLAEGP